MQTLKLRDGADMPQFGLGVWKTPNDIAAQVVAHALKSGYRHVDTAAVYGNEQGVGEGLKASGVARGDVFVTTKLWNADQGFDSTLRAFNESLKRLGTDYVDLYLIHWPAPKNDRFVDTWRALLQLKAEGRAKSIGVSNFEPEHLERLASETGELPVVNQIELHPTFQQRALRAFHASHGIATESWSPLGQGQLLTDPAIAAIAKAHGRSPAQVIIRWHLQSGLIVIPKSVTPARIDENAKVFDFVLSADQMAVLDGLDRKDGRIGPNPLTADF
ncbi:oxidoreductase [Azorhizobium oxalatiphilum]|uniref:Oxidoreductase n=1 Tax=Azorhizobium oxalatiphilum TaxID=980631 RepID=A0A917C296_9HYPH|nr:aldo/keto reductase [Azorhizobium oxalatiphilum]GGF68824.1 oxidoreductase [Azorhizobium oxalatiphilum]